MAVWASERGSDPHRHYLSDFEAATPRAGSL